MTAHGIDGTFDHRDGRIAYTVRGEGDRVVVLIHGLLLSRLMQAPLAATLASQGNRVVTVDLLGHGDSDRPAATEAHSITAFAGQVVALLDHLDVERAVIGGTSLGANVSLEVASLSPDRVQGLVVEMPVLDHALLACATVFTPLCALLSTAPRLVRLVTLPARAIPRGALSGWPEVGLEVLRQDPEGAARVLRGLLFGRTAPTREARTRIEAPTLVIGHPRDPVHPFTDSEMLVREMPDARLVRASSIAELRVRPARITGEIAAFLDECFPPSTPVARRRSA